MSEELTAKALKLIDLVAYQDGSVVSRVVLKQKGGNVTLFAFDAGQELSEHTTPFDAMVNVLEGEVEITISGTPIHAGAGQMVIMPRQPASRSKGDQSVQDDAHDDPELRMTIVPHDRLDPDALDALLEEFVTRDGAVQGHTEAPMSQKMAAVLRQLKSGIAVIVFDEVNESCTIMPKENLPADISEPSSDP